jgi:MFS transporter, ACS family, glucarate transporter
MTSSAPTSIRWLIVFLAMLAAVLLYLERVCVSVAEVYIREDLNISKQQMDLAFGAFFIAYALAQVPSGWLSQRYGPRITLTLYMLGWSIFGVLIALAQDVYTLIAARFLLGISQAGAYPTAALLVKRWMPDRSRGLASSIVAFGGRFGGAGANFITAIMIVSFVPLNTPATFDPSDLLDSLKFQEQLADPKPAALLPYKARFSGVVTDPTKPINELNTLIPRAELFEGLDPQVIRLASDGEAIRKKPVEQRSAEEAARLNRLILEQIFPGSLRQLHVKGWRPSLMVYGVLGVLVGLLFWWLARDWPHSHPWANAAEVTLIEEQQSKKGEVGIPTSIPWKKLILSRNQWFFSLNQFFSNIGWVFLITLVPRYLSERFAVPVELRGFMTTVPLFVASFSLIFGGLFTDWLTRRKGRRWGRSVPLSWFKLPCVFALILCPELPTAWTVVIALTIMAVSQDFGIPAVWAFAQDTGGPQAATVLGWANMWGNLGAGLAPILMGLIQSLFLAMNLNGWDGVLYFGALAFALCGIAGYFMNADEPLFR